MDSKGEPYRAIDRGLDADRRPVERFHIRRDDVGPEIDLDRADMLDADLHAEEEDRVRHELEHDAGTAGPGMDRVVRVVPALTSRTRPSAVRPAMICPDEERLSRSLRASSARLRRPN